MRERPVGCVNQTLQQHLAGVHTTFEDNRVCARCAMRRPSSPVPLLDAGRRGGSSLPTAASSPPAAFSSSARQARGGGTSH